MSPLDKEIIQEKLFVILKNLNALTPVENMNVDNYYESFTTLGELKIISPELAEKLAPSSGLRKRLVHEYDSLDNSIVLDPVKIAEELYLFYIKEVEAHLSGYKKRRG
jgi:uncharacterized protein YutE (UPF0331/DUF86 family)